MGAWGTGAFENDAAWDWSSDLVDSDDLSFVHETLTSVGDAEDDELHAELGCQAIAACEGVARLQGRARGSQVEAVDQWVRSHAVKPTAALVKLATNALDRVTSHCSELAQRWRKDPTWAASMLDLRKRIAGVLPS